MIEKNNLMKRIEWIDNARALCILYVICIAHLGEYTILDLHSPLEIELTKGVLSVLYFVSGWGFRNRCFDLKSDIINFIKTRLIRIYPLYLVGLVILFVVSKKYGYPYVVDMRQFMYSLLCMASIVPPPPSTLWYINVLFVFYIVTPLIKRASNIKNCKSIFLIILTLLMIFRFTSIEFDIRILYYFPLYCIGLNFNKFEKILTEFSYKKVAIVTIALIFLCKVNILISDTPYFHCKWLCEIVAIWGIGITSILFIISICAKLPRKISKILSIISYSSLCIFLFHRPFYATISYFWKGELPLIVAYGMLLPSLILLSFMVQKGYDLMVKKLKII